MPYQPKRGGTIYNRKVAAIAAFNRQIRDVIEQITEGGITNAQLYQYLTAIALITVRSDDVLRDLEDFDQ